jgi:hypothetical protein
MSINMARVSVRYESLCDNNIARRKLFMHKFCMVNRKRKFTSDNETCEVAVAMLDDYWHETCEVAVAMLDDYWRLHLGDSLVALASPIIDLVYDYYQPCVCSLPLWPKDYVSSQEEDRLSLHWDGCPYSDTWCHRKGLSDAHMPSCIFADKSIRSLQRVAQQ